MIYFLIIIFLIAIIIWLIGFFTATDFSVPSQDISQYKKVLVIFPHPDDETFGSGGLIHRLSTQHSDVTALIFTKGEKGTPTADLKSELKEIRSAELQSVGKILGISTIIHEDFGDGELKYKKTEMTEKIRTVMNNLKPDLVITYDLSGLYGHEDHIACAEVVTDVIQKEFNNVTLWYSSQPKKILAMIKLPEHMAKDPEFKKRQMKPSHKIFLGVSITPKIQAIYSHKSQFNSFREGLPLRPLPPWFIYSMSLFEYFYEVKK